MSLADAIAAAAAQVAAPLTVALEGPDQFASFLGGLGLRLDLDAEGFAAVQRLLPVAGHLDELSELADALTGDAPPAAELAADAVGALRSVLDTIAALGHLSAADVAALAAPLDDPATWAAIAAALPEHLLVTWLELEHPVLAGLLTFIGGIAEAADATPPAPARVLDWPAFGSFLADPAAHLARLYGWGGNFASDPLLRAIAGVLMPAGVGAAFTDPPEATDQAWWGGLRPAEVQALRITLLEESAGGGPLAIGALLLPAPARPGIPGPPARMLIGHEAVTSAGAGTLPLDDEWELRIDGAADITGGIGVVLGPHGDEVAAGAVTGSGITLTGRPQTPWRLAGSGTGARIEIRDVILEVTLQGTARAPEFVVTAGTGAGLALVLDPEELDPFVATLFGAAPVEVTAGLLVSWSSQAGLTFGGSAGFTVTIPVDRTLGPVRIETVSLTLTGGADGLAAVLAVTGSARLGPLSATADQIGIGLALAPAPDGAGALGAAGLSIGIDPPAGVGLGLDLGVTAGGGFLDISPDHSRYSGVIQLDMLGVGICAVAIIDTTGDWSMFFALFIDVPAIQLGFGFTLTGLGGLFGFNRALQTEALESAIRSGSLETVLFPADPVADAPDVIAGLAGLFPPSDGSYVFGPVARIGWGTPTLIEAELGVVISLPDPVVIAVIGSLTSLLPTEDLDLVAVHVDVSGVVDATAGTLAIDASLHDSRVTGFALTGAMAVRAGFLGEPSFLMALGGFHPRFDAPAGFPAQSRLSLAVSASPVIDLSFECYLAVASNSVQFGAALHLSAEVEGFGIEGGASFDALVDLSPFRVVTSLGCYISVTAAGVDLMGVWLDARVEGPNPWRVTGEARFTILGVDEHLRIDQSIGASRSDPAPDPVDLLTALAGALAQDGAWSVAGAAGAAGVITGGAPPAADELVAHPDSVLAVSQRVMPLGIRLDKVGDTPLDQHDTFEVEPAARSMTATGTVRDWFAPGQYLELGSGERLAGPSFEQLPSGIEFGGGIQAGPARTGTLDFEEILRDPGLGEPRTGLGTVSLVRDGRAEVLSVLAGTAARDPSQRFAVAGGPDAVTLAPSSFAVTDRETGQVRLRAGTWSAARSSPSGRRAATTVVPDWEAPR